ncbi:replication-associated recombination protein A [Butyrivibrio sp. FCS006]|uniref:replication-associated recombination protein A n=1 Tax=Butyrivibrio sp. FCS006 TaxID=1280684 RepID=UPI00041A0B81|nr:replication-associated recombination protein A [Butyrivibrio sp. FCS006]
MDLFEYMAEGRKEKEAPLAARMRPQTLDEVVGQEDIIGEDKLLYRAIKADRLSSIILYGPPGVGKTTLAKVIANTTSADFHQVNATIAGKKDMESVVETAKNNLGGYGRKTILFIDEIHRFNKAQQDYLLPYVEDGTLILIGATTENPYFEVNGALISRSRIFELKPLSKENILTLIKRAFESDRGVKQYNAEITDEAADFLADIADGDARAALNAIELAVLTTKPSADAKIHVDLAVAEECIQKKAIRYDKTGDNHYDTIAAFIESMCGSDPDAALYYLGRMLAAGEDVKYIARRMLVAASEEVGNADPMAICVAASAAIAVERVGMPEGRIILAQAATYIASAPKSNSAYLGIEKVLQIVRETGNLPIPPYLQDSSYKGAAKLGRGVGYKYAHNYPNHWVEQQYLPDAIKDMTFYEPNDIGHEKDIKEYFRNIGKDPQRYEYKDPSEEGNPERPWE